MNGAVLVTGGSRGIGAAIVQTLVADGWQVAFTYLTERDRATAVEESSGGRARAFQLDLRDRSRPGALVAEVQAALGELDGLVNNAGWRHAGILAMTSDADFDRLMEVNLAGVFRLCRAVLPGMMHRRRGSIVNISSLAATRGLAGQASYAAAKAGVLGMTKSLAREVGRRGVRVNAVVPGFVLTDMTASLPEKVVAALRADECLPAGTSPLEVAAVVSFLLSSRASAMTGQAVAVDAGASA